MGWEEFYAYGVLPLVIFMARVGDVSLGTFRIIAVSRGRKSLATVLGFFEVLIWLVAIGQIFGNLTNVVGYIAYALGFATGNYIGILLEERLAMGEVLIRIITRQSGENLTAKLREQNIGVTVVDAQGATGGVHVIFAVIKRRDVVAVVETIREFNPKAFYTLEDVRAVNKGVFPTHRLIAPSALSVFGARRKGK